MADIGQQPAAGVLDVGEPGGHGVERTSDRVELAAQAGGGDPGRVVAFRDVGGGGREISGGTGDPAGEVGADRERGGERDDQSDRERNRIGRRVRLLDVFGRLRVDPAFDAFDRACKLGFGRGFTKIGVGGTIPFIALFGRRFAKVPLILNGVMDPLTNAHGPDESMDIGLFKRVARTNAALYGELRAGPS